MERGNILSNKIYVIDTNVLMYAGKKALTSFEDNEVVIPFVVVEELEKKRLEDGLVGAMARYALREIDSLREQGKLKEGVTVNARGGTLRIEMNHIDEDHLPEAFLKWKKSNDARILIVAHNLHIDEQRPEGKGREVILVTNDLPLRIKADSMFDITVMPFYSKGSIQSGFSEESVTSNVINDLFNSNRPTPMPENLQMDGMATKAFNLRGLHNPQHSALIVASEGQMRRVRDISAMGKVKGKSREQKIALDYLYDNSKRIVSLGGKAGTGKSLMSLVSAMEQVTKNDPDYRKIVLIRPIYAVGGQDLGALPGDAEDKMGPWRKAVYDSVEGIVDSNMIHKMNEDGALDVIPATHLRGRTFHNTFTIVDEAQNFEPSVLLTILSRIGHGSKIVFLWDATQRDNNKIGYNDGIVSVVDKLKDNHMFAHISLKKSERSEVAELAGNILEDYIN